MWIEGDVLTDYWKGSPAAEQPIRFKLLQLDQASVTEKREAFDGKVVSVFRCTAELTNDQMQAVIRLFVKGEIPVGVPINFKDTPMPVQYTLDAVATLRRSGPQPPKP